ncbi:hypothetical protein [Pontibacter sp. G13]|uniref:hypothetical protein n=1 Tax=Pontibacter sp. G13 TaxID=3074898 RepID=UPI00288AA906|nr:hypothetical protein [Pontibacter sp. G13]WNJ20840.1 hypothetical protein RJD25_10180 [Pontibacter sp. G13]
MIPINKDQVLAANASLDSQSLPADLLTLLAAAAEANPQGKCAEFSFSAQQAEIVRSHSYQSAYELALKTAALLKNLQGTQSGNIALLIPPIPEALPIALGAISVGDIWLLSPMLDESLVSQALEKHGVGVLITVAAYPDLGTWNYAESFIESVSSLTHILQIDLVQYLGRFKRMTTYFSLRRGGKAEKRDDQIMGDLFKTLESIEAPKYETLSPGAGEGRVWSPYLDAHGHLGWKPWTQQLLIKTTYLLDQLLPKSESQLVLHAQMWEQADLWIAGGLLPLLRRQSLVSLGPNGWAGMDLSRDLPVLKSLGLHLWVSGRAEMGGFLGESHAASEVAKQWICLDGIADGTLIQEMTQAGVQVFEWLVDHAEPHAGTLLQGGGSRCELSAQTMNPSSGHALELIAQAHPDIWLAAAIHDADSDKWLLYLQRHPGSELDLPAINDWIRSQLAGTDTPAPSGYRVVEPMPVGLGGEVDYQAFQ